ncbi:MAG: SRPBCC family protein [Chitinophagaceae bacterium]
MIFLYIIYAVIGLILALLIIALFLPGEYHIEQTIIIKKPVKWVMDHVADLNYYAKWNPWQMMEEGSLATITGTPKTIGHKYAWKGKKIGEGSLTLRDIDESNVDFNLEFIKPWKSLANDSWVFEEWGNDETKVIWMNNGDLPYPIARLMGPSLNKTLNKQFRQGLENLKKLCEQ